ncbi:MAG: DUF4398 domain-containing protein [Proteobacteria bacterium]|nr:MAG: DUF4398 domain-containing protein [Pseudomonadota bacterium]
MIRKQGSLNKRALSVKRVAVAALWLSVMFGCASAPVQEMSDARQSIAAARDAGAAQLAPKSLSEAERYLEQAKQLLDKGLFDQARQSARTARELALEARRKVLESDR